MAQNTDIQKALGAAMFKATQVKQPVTIDKGAQTKLQLTSMAGPMVRYLYNSGSFQGISTVADVRAGRNMYVNFRGPDGDSYLYFYANGYNEGAFLQWNQSNRTHKFSQGLQLGSAQLGYTVAGWGKALELENFNVLKWKLDDTHCWAIGQAINKFYIGIRSTADNTSGPALYSMVMDADGQVNINYPLDMASNKITSVTDPTDAQDAATKAYVDEPMTAQKEPTGFPNRTGSVVTFTDGTRTLEISATVTDFDYWIKGIKYTITDASVVITDTEGMWYFYLNTSGNLIATQAFVDEDAYFTYAYVAVVHWDASANVHLYLGEERHGITMSGNTHKYLHDVVGTAWEDGLALDMNNGGNGNSAQDAQFGYTAGEIHDEDIQHMIPVASDPASIPIFWLKGASAEWQRKTADSFPMVYEGTVGGDYAGVRMPYNQFTGGTWQLTDPGQGNFVLMHYFATGDNNQHIIGIQGQEVYTTRNSAREGAADELNNIYTVGLPFVEFKAIATVLYQTSTGYSNDPHAKTVAVNAGTHDYIDWRVTEGGGAAVGAVNDHGNLAGLADDDHQHYVLVDGSRAIAVLRSNGNMLINYGGPVDGDSYLYFFDGGSNQGAYLKWDDDPGTFNFNKALDMSSNKITSVNDPTSAQDAATKKYVDDTLGNTAQCISMYPNSRLTDNWTWGGADGYLESSTIITGDQDVFIYLNVPEGMTSVIVRGRMLLTTTSGGGQDMDATVALQRKTAIGAYVTIGSVDTNNVVRGTAGTDSGTFDWVPTFTEGQLDYLGAQTQYRISITRALHRTDSVTVAYVRIYGVEIS